jgi:DNA-binding NarL/FixJ family response regulator
VRSIWTACSTGSRSACSSSVIRERLPRGRWLKCDREAADGEAMPPRRRREASSRSSPLFEKPSAQAEHRPSTSPRGLEELTGRELEILGLITDGLFNREISERLVLSEETVKTHVRHVLAKLGARSRAHAVAIALRSGLLD